MYPEEMVQPMRDELTSAGVRELRSPEEVDAVLPQEGETTLIYINSVCGCAAGTARPGLIRALDHEILPTHITTVFAGVDGEAVAHARRKIAGYPPSSPSVALFREGKLVDVVQRHEIESRSAEQLTARLTQAFDKYCGAEIDESIVMVDPLADLEIGPLEVHERLERGVDFKFLDARTEQERAMASIEGTELVTRELFEEIMETWPRDTGIVVHCHTGARSFDAARHLLLEGKFTDVKSMSGGIAAWSATVDSSVPTY